MKSEYVSHSLLSLKDKIPHKRFNQLHSLLTNSSDAKFMSLQFLKMHNPALTLIFALFLGGIGVDRFYLGEHPQGFGKLALGLSTFSLSFEIYYSKVTFLIYLAVFIASFLWQTIDVFTSYAATKQKNFENIEKILK